MTTTGIALSIGGYALTLLGACIMIWAACTALRRTSDASLREWARRQVEKARVRLGLPIHRTAELRGHGQMTPTAAPRVTRGPIAEVLLRPMYQALDTLLLRAQKTEATTEDIKREADEFKHWIADHLSADRAHARREAKMALVGSALTIIGIVICIVAVIVG
jgi:hypothetical protein